MLSHWLADAAFGDRQRILVEEPPRHGKSELASHWFPVWYLTLFPQNRIILASYEADFAAEWGRKVRDTINEHSEELGIQINEASCAANRWDLKQGGGMRTAGVGGPITGKGANLLLVDDPVKNFEEAHSPTYRKKAVNWWQSTAYTRLEPNAAAVVVMTRWHEGDLIGHLKRSQNHEGAEQWDELRLPAIAEQDDPLGRKPGEALWPWRYDVEQLRKIEKAVASMIWAGLYQQRPAPPEGWVVKRAWLKFWQEMPKSFDEVIQSWDLAFKGGPTADFVVGQIWGRNGADKYLLDQVRARMDFPTTLAAFHSFSLKWPQAKRKLVEDAANGAALVASFKNKISGIIPVKPMGAKEARLAAVSGDFESGNVYLPDPDIYPWVHDYIEELLTFPSAQNDDQVDSTTQALNRLGSDGLSALRRLATW